jgi:hypothetical protein
MDLARRGATHHVTWRPIPAPRVASARFFARGQKCGVYCIKSAPIGPYAINLGRALNLVTV